MFPGGRASKGRVVFSSETTGEEGKEINGMKLLANKDIEGRDLQPLCFLLPKEITVDVGLCCLEDMTQILGRGRT